MSSREAVKAGILRTLQEARGRGLEVSQLACDLVSVRSAHDCVHHFTTLRGTELGSGRRVDVSSFLACEVWRPEPVCPCGQLTVDWD